MKKSSKIQPIVTVIVTTKNNEATLRTCLTSIREQTYPRIELVVVDNFSTDATMRIARTYAHKVVSQGPERSAQRNVGVEKARGSYVCIIDSDMELSPRVIEECVEKVQADSDLHGLIIPEESVGRNFWAACKRLERNYYYGVDWIECARFFAKKTYKEVGGYDADLVGGEDCDLPNRIKERYGEKSIGRVKALIHHDEGRLSLRGTCKKKFYYAKQLDRYRAKTANARDFRKQANPFKRYTLFFSKPKKILSNPGLFAGMLFLKSAEFLAGALGYASTRIQTKRGALRVSICIIVLLLLLALVFHRWLSFAVFSYSDWWFLFAESLQDMRHLGPWVSSYGFGEPNLMLWRWPLEYVLSLFGRAGWDSNVAGRFVVLWPSVFLLALAAFGLLRRLTGSNIGAFVGSLVVVLNTYFLASDTQGHNLIVVASAFGILAFWVYIVALANRRLTQYALCSLLLFVCGAYDFRVLYIFIGIIGAYAVFHFAARRCINFRTLVGHLLWVSSVFLLNAYWLLPGFGSGTLADNAVLSRPLFGTDFWSLPHAITLYHPFWTGHEPSWFSVQPIPLYAWLIPIAAAAGLVLGFRSGWVRFFAIITLLGILLSKQMSPPFTGLYPWLYENVPGFSAFREPTKFYILTVLGYAVLISVLVADVRRRTRGSRSPFARAALLAVVGLILLPLAMYAWPLVNGSVKTMFEKRSVPSDYVLLKQMLDEDKVYSRTLWLPRDTRWSFYDNDHPRVNGLDFIGKQAQPLLADHVHSRDSTFERYEKFFGLEESQTFLRNASIGYIIVPHEEPLESRVDQLFPEYGRREHYIDMLNKVPYLQRVDLGDEQVSVYRTTSSVPRVAAFGSAVHLSQNTGLSEKLGFVNGLMAGQPYVYVDGASPGEYGYGLHAPFEELLTDNGAVVSDRTFGEMAGPLWVKSLDDLYVRGTRSGLDFVYKPAGRFNPRIASDESGAETVVAEFDMPGGGTSYVRTGHKLHRVDTTIDLRLGPANQAYVVPVYHTMNESIIADPGFDKGPWEKEVGDCSNYDDDRDIGMQHVAEAGSGGLLRLWARRHTACSQLNVPVAQTGPYVLSLQYRTRTGNQAGVHVQFNDAKKTVVTERLLSKDVEAWQTAELFVDAPADATKAIITLYAYETDKKTVNYVDYDNVKFSALAVAEQVSIRPRESELARVNALSLPADQKYRFEPNNYAAQNLVTNGSFENGLWNHVVGDCNNKDAAADIGQKQSQEAAHGMASLELWARRHIACTSKLFKIEQPGNHFLSFYYRSPSGSEAGYFLQFNDGDRTVVSDRLPSRSAAAWQKLTRPIVVPPDATEVELYLYSYETDSRKLNAVQYDNIVFMEVPDMRYAAMVMQQPQRPMVAPARLEYFEHSASHRTVRVSGAHAAFMLTSSESYHKGWKVYPRKRSTFAGCSAGAWSQTPDYQEATEVIRCADGNAAPYRALEGSDEATAMFDAAHVKVNGIANGWTIDPSRIKNDLNSDYWRQNDDGSLEFVLDIHYQPQAQADTGKIITLFTFAGTSSLASFGAAQRARGKKYGRLVALSSLPVIRFSSLQNETKRQ